MFGIKKHVVLGERKSSDYQIEGLVENFCNSEFCRKWLFVKLQCYL